MIFWLIFIAFVACCIWTYVKRDEWSDTPAICAIFSGAAFVVSIIIFLIMNLGVNGRIESNKQRYDTLVYQYENDIYDNDNDLGKRELMSDIQSWNEDLANYKAIQDDFWIGTYVPNIYDQFEFIELERGE